MMKSYVNGVFVMKILDIYSSYGFSCNYQVWKAIKMEQGL